MLNNDAVAVLVNFRILANCISRLTFLVRKYSIFVLHCSLWDHNWINEFLLLHQFHYNVIDCQANVCWLYHVVLDYWFSCKDFYSLFSNCDCGCFFM